MIGVKKDENKTIEVNLPENYPKKELANKKAKFECKIINVQKASETKIDDTFAKNMGAKDLTDLKIINRKTNFFSIQASTRFNYKKRNLRSNRKLHKIELPKNLVLQEINSMTQHLKKEDVR